MKNLQNWFDSWGCLCNVKLYCPQFDSRNVHSIVYVLLCQKSSYHKEIILSFFQIYLSVNESITDCIDIDTKTILKNVLDKFIAIA